MSKAAIAVEFFRFLKARRKVWLMPVILALGILSVLLIVAGSAALAPFIYALF